jgi:hypothetical protein
MLLSEARTRVALMVDDADAVRWSTTNIDEALRTAQAEVWQLAAFAAPAHFAVESTSLSSSAAGVLNLASLAPLKILALHTYNGGQRLNILPLHRTEALANSAGVVACAITYVPRVTFPASAATAFTWGHASITDTGTLDALMCCLAATELLITEAKTNPVLEQRKAELRDAITTRHAQASWAVLPLFGGDGSGESGLGYIMTAPDQAQLVLV